MKKSVILYYFFNYRFIKSYIHCSQVFRRNCSFCNFWLIKKMFIYSCKP